MPTRWLMPDGLAHPERDQRPDEDERSDHRDLGGDCLGARYVFGGWLVELKVGAGGFDCHDARVLERRRVGQHVEPFDSPSTIRVADDGLNVVPLTLSDFPTPLRSRPTDHRGSAINDVGKGRYSDDVLEMRRASGILVEVETSRELETHLAQTL